MIRRKRNSDLPPLNARTARDLQAKLYNVGVACGGRPGETVNLFEAAARTFAPTLPFEQLVIMCQSAAKKAAECGDQACIDETHDAITVLFDALKIAALVPMPHEDDAETLELVQRVIRERGEAECAAVKVFQMPGSEAALDQAFVELTEADSWSNRLKVRFCAMRDQLHRRPAVRAMR